MPINFGDLNKDLHDEVSKRQQIPMNVDPAHVDEAIAGIELIRADIKKDIIEFIKQINRATMKAKDLEPNSDEFNKQIDLMHHYLNGVMTYCGSLIPYTTLQNWIKRMKEEK